MDVFMTKTVISSSTTFHTFFFSCEYILHFLTLPIQHTAECCGTGVTASYHRWKHCVSFLTDVPAKLVWFVRTLLTSSGSISKTPHAGNIIKTSCSTMAVISHAATPLLQGCGDRSSRASQPATTTTREETRTNIRPHPTYQHNTTQRTGI